MKKTLKNLKRIYDPIVDFPCEWEIRLSEYEDMLTYFVQKKMMEYMRKYNAN